MSSDGTERLWRDVSGRKREDRERRVINTEGGADVRVSEQMREGEYDKTFFLYGQDRDTPSAASFRVKR